MDTVTSVVDIVLWAKSSEICVSRFMKELSMNHVVAYAAIKDHVLFLKSAVLLM